MNGGFYGIFKDNIIKLKITLLTMKTQTYYWCLFIFFSSTLIFAQKTPKDLAIEFIELKGEVIFTMQVDDPLQLPALSKKFSIVHYEEISKTAKLMANKSQFDQFLKKNVSFQVTTEDNIIGYRTMTSDLLIKAATFPLTAYPTYADYEEMMNDFASNNSGICKVEDIGATTEGDKSILFVKLSDNVSQNEQEPRVMFTSSMHGDEIAGYPMMLNLIDFLINAYNDTSDPRHEEIKELLDNNEIWINPLANPDGTFRNSANNTSVANATRGNANNVDLNRNYPDPDKGDNPDGNTYQVETNRFMDFAADKHFVLSANFHGGIELINYPWDTYAGAHPDEDYFIHISEEYRDLCQDNSPAGYFDARDNGITNGYEWYEVAGGRQDYQIYFEKGREVTVELSNAKTPAASQLVNYWNYNKEALIAFMKQTNYGIRGVVTDAVTGNGIDAKITIEGKESFETWTPTELPEGDYYRPIKSGTYTMRVEAACYETKTLTNITIADYETIIRDVQLTPIGTVAPVGLTASDVQSTSAIVAWNGSSDGQYDLRYRPVGTSNWTVVPVSTNSTTLTGLSVETAYEAQVRSKCSSGAVSPYSDSISFSTTEIPACDGINNFPYQESFETDLGQWTNVTGDDIDWTRDSGGTPSNTTGPSTGDEGAFYLYTEASSNANGNPDKEAILQSPCLDLSNLSGAVLEFGYHMYGTNIGTLETEISTDDGATYTTIWSESGNQGDEWKVATVDLASYAGTVVKIRFKGTTGNGWRSDIAIDNIRINSNTPDTESPTTPTGLSSSNITATSVTLAWNASTDNIGVVRYDIYQDGNLSTDNITTTATISGLSPQTDYSFYVIAVDAAGNMSSASNTINVSTSDVAITYCESKGLNVNYEYIDYVGIGTIDNETSANAGYADFTNVVTDLAYGQNTIELSAAFVSSPYQEYWRVWIDYNKNGSFETEELMVSENSNSDAVLSYNFVVPTTALEGTTRMRVTMKYNSEASPCEEFEYGEVEDYTVNINANSFQTNGLNKEGALLDLKLYPNPVKTGILFIKGTNVKGSEIRVLNYLGQTVLKTTLTGDQINVSTLSKGIYILEVNNTKDRIFKDFVVN